MSNLTRLQAVSSSLDTAIGKANSLPNAGSGGGGGGASVETCTVTITKPTRGAPYSVRYTNADFDPAELQTSMALTDTVKVVKNTMVMIVHNQYGINLNGEYEAIYGGGAVGTSVFFVKGDVTVNMVEREPA